MDIREKILRKYKEKYEFRKTYVICMILNLLFNGSLFFIAGLESVFTNDGRVVLPILILISFVSYSFFMSYRLIAINRQLKKLINQYKGN